LHISHLEVDAGICSFQSEENGTYLKFLWHKNSNSRVTQLQEDYLKEFSAKQLNFFMQLGSPRISTFLSAIKVSRMHNIPSNKRTKCNSSKKTTKKSDLQVGMTYLWLDMADHILNFLARVLYSAKSRSSTNSVPLSFALTIRIPMEIQLLDSQCLWHKSVNTMLMIIRPEKRHEFEAQYEVGVYSVSVTTTG
jgi:hypothetical protein